MAKARGIQTLARSGVGICFMYPNFVPFRVRLTSTQIDGVPLGGSDSLCSISSLITFLPNTLSCSHVGREAYSSKEIVLPGR